MLLLRGAFSFDFLKNSCILIDLNPNRYMALNNDITLGQFYPGDSVLHRLDPRSKLVASLIFMTCVLLAVTPLLILCYAVLCLSAVVVSKIPPANILGSLKPFSWLFLVTFGIHLFTTGGVPLFGDSALGITLTREGLVKAFVFTSRLGLLLVLAGVFTMTTTPVEIADSLDRLLAPLKRLKLPVNEFVLMVSIALRFLPILVNEANRVKSAQLSRGLSLQGNLVRRVKSMLPMILPLFVSAIRRAEDLAVAMEARSYVSGAERTSFRRLKFGAGDYGLLVLVAGFAVAAALSV